MDISCLYVKCDEPMVTIIVQFTQPIQVSAHTVIYAAPQKVTVYAYATVYIFYLLINNKCSSSN